MPLSRPYKLYGRSVVALAIGTAAGPAMGAPPDADEGRRHFQTGLALSEKQSYEEALREFRRAYELDQRPSALRNTAECLRHLQRLSEARATFELLLTKHNTELSQTAREEIADALRALGSQPPAPAPPPPQAPALPAPPAVYTFEITALPQDATIALDGRSVGVGHVQGEMTPGHHLIEVTATGFEPFRTEFDATAGQGMTENVVLTSLVSTPSAPSPPEAQPKEEHEGNGSGFYASVGTFAGFRVGGVATLDCPTAAQCSDGSKAYGGGLALRVGYSLGLVGFEVVGAFDADYRGATHNFTDSSLAGTDASNLSWTEDYTIVSINGFIGAGARLTTPGQTAHATLGVTPGLTLGEFALNRTTTGNVISTMTSTTGYRGFGLLLDGGVLIGNTPGLKLYLGALVWLAFPGTIATSAASATSAAIVDGTSSSLTGSYPNPSYPLGSGTQVTVGPMISLQFGH